MTTNEIKAKYPDLYKNILNQGKNEVLSEIKKINARNESNVIAIAKITKIINFDYQETADYTVKLKALRGGK